MNFIDLTHEIKNGIAEYPDDPKTEISFFKKPTIDDSLALLEYKTGMHTGTHIDAPFHYILNGKKVTDIPLNDLCGRATVIKSNSKEISLPHNHLEEIVIIITGECNNFGSYDYFHNNPYLTNESAETLIKNNVKIVALDTCSVDKNGENKIHKKLLENNVCIVENLTNTDQLNRKEYYAFFIPLNIDCEASPIRAFVRKVD